MVSERILQSTLPLISVLPSGCSMQLRNLGWDSHFQDQLNELDTSELLVGRVIKTDGSKCDIINQDGVIRARVPGRMRDTIPPAVGDWVLIKPLEIGHEIYRVLEPKNRISRKAAGRDIRQQVVASNVDYVFIVMGLDGDFNIRRLERYLIMVTSSGSTPVIVLNKTDISPNVDEMVEKVCTVSREVPILTVSVLNGDGLEDIREYLIRGSTAVLVGSSGVGKSTLINALLGCEAQRTDNVREKNSRGRHVTTHRELFIIPNGGVIIDNPGIREIQLWGEISDMEEPFQDITELSAGCRFNDCQHLSEPGCRVKLAIENGELSHKRYESYLKLRKELQHLARKQTMSSEAAERSRWKGIKKNAQGYRRYKEGRD